MREEVLFTVDAPYRRALPVKGWYFGNEGKKSLAVMGALRGNELQQMYISSQLIQALKKLEAGGNLSPDCGILVIPCANQFSMNVGRRFWAADNTDINRMFPGYNEGETTQRIADRLFTALQGYDWGIHLTSFHLAGDHLAHIRVTEGHEETAKAAIGFGLPYVMIRKPQPYDTTTLHYNWPIWDTRAFSFYTRDTDQVDVLAARHAMEAILRFLRAQGLLKWDGGEGNTDCATVLESDLRIIHTTRGGLMFRKCQPGDLVKEGDVLAQLLDPCSGEVIETLRADCTGRVFFACRAQLVTGHEVAFQLLPE